MITTFKSARRNILVATAVLASASLVHAAKIDPTIVLTQAAANAADIEDVVEIAHDTALQMGSGAIKLNNTNAGALARFMSEGILGKSPAVGDNRVENKVEEVPEALANIVQGIIPSTKFKKKGKSAIKTIMNQGLRAAKKDSTFAVTTIFTDVALSVAVTIANNPAIDDKTQGKIFKYLNKAAKSIAGKPNKANIKLGLNLGFNSTSANEARAEDANQYATIHQINDPETDFRPI
jgi:hypothetical protein